MAGDNRTTKLLQGKSWTSGCRTEIFQGHEQGLSPYRLFHSVEQAQHRLSQNVQFAFGHRNLACVENAPFFVKQKRCLRFSCSHDSKADRDCIRNQATCYKHHLVFRRTFFKNPGWSLAKAMLATELASSAVRDSHYLTILVRSPLRVP